MPATERVLGSELRVGDSILVWFSPGPATIIKLSPYTGPLRGDFKKGAWIACFAGCKTTMIIDVGDVYARTKSEGTGMGSDVSPYVAAAARRAENSTNYVTALISARLKADGFTPVAWGFGQISVHLADDTGKRFRVTVEVMP